MGTIFDIHTKFSADISFVASLNGASRVKASLIIEISDEGKMRSDLLTKHSAAVTTLFFYKP